MRWGVLDNMLHLRLMMESGIDRENWARVEGSDAVHWLHCLVIQKKWGDRGLKSPNPRVQTLFLSRSTLILLFKKYLSSLVR